MSQRTLSLAFLAVVGAAATIAQTPQAVAADLDLDAGYASIPPVAEQKVEFGSGWYIRGDIGVTRGLSVKAGDEPYDTAAIGSTAYANRASYTLGVFDGPGFSPPAISAASSSQLLYNASLGMGYQFNHWFRADFTADFRQPVESVYGGAAVRCITGTSPVTNPDGTVTTENIVSAICSPTLKSSLKSYGVLVNGYYDIGTWSRITPYVGAGIGMSFGHASTSSTYYQNNLQPYAGISYTDALSKGTFYQNFDRSQSQQYYNLAFALMGGVAIDVFDHTKLDIGYRYLHLGQVLGTDLNAQEVRAGLRYMIDN